MNFFGTTYSYDISSLSSISSGDIYAIGGVFAIGIFIFFLLPFIQNLQESRKKKLGKISKRKVLEELILMKEIQGEIEQEMRDALIHTELQSKTETEPAK